MSAIPPSTYPPHTLTIEPYKQEQGLPTIGNSIVGHFDDSSIVVYQAYSPKIAEYAVKHQRFGGDDFSFNRMSWIKTSFAWMQYRSGWNTKSRQERTLAIKITRAGFDSVVANAVGSKYIQEVHGTRENFELLKTRGDVRLQWDPDYIPALTPQRLQRRAIQLGLRGETLRRYATEWIISIEDITPFVVEMRERLRRDPSGATLWMPIQQVYEPYDDVNSTPF